MLKINNIKCQSLHAHKEKVCLEGGVGISTPTIFYVVIVICVKALSCSQAGRYCLPHDGTAAGWNSRHGCIHGLLFAGVGSKGWFDRHAVSVLQCIKCQLIMLQLNSLNMAHSVVALGWVVLPGSAGVQSWCQAQSWVLGSTPDCGALSVPSHISCCNHRTRNAQVHPHAYVPRRHTLTCIDHYGNQHSHRIQPRVYSPRSVCACPCATRVRSMRQLADLPSRIVCQWLLTVLSLSTLHQSHPSRQTRIGLWQGSAITCETPSTPPLPKRPRIVRQH